MGITTPKVYIIILNWQGWKDTIECLESIFRINYSNFNVVVCDNGSQDGSVDFIIRWANGQLNCMKNSRNSLTNYTYPPIPKPIKYKELYCDNALAENTNNDDYPLLLIHTGSNLGFAGGCNQGIRYALKHRAEMIWLLNNDMVVSPESLGILVNHLSTRKQLGFISPEIYFYQDPSLKAGAGGAFAPFNPRLTLVTKDDKVQDFYSCDHVTGAAVLVRTDMIKSVGYMNENYFMYREETDWMIRAKRLGMWETGVAGRAKVWHKIAASSGNKSAFQEYYNTRNTLTILQRFYPFHYLWIICIYFPYRIGAITLKSGNLKLSRLLASFRGLKDHLISIEGKVNI
jgi:GT2 family glycosyltransferase